MIRLRPIIEGDLPFLRKLYGSTRSEELMAVPWSTTEKEAFLDMQFQAQHAYYQAHYAQAQFDVIELDGEPIGRLYVDRRADDIRIVDIALLPAYRNRGIGSKLLVALLQEGQDSGRPVTIHVERFNPALNLYKRLGFRQIADRGVHLLLAWQAETVGSSPQLQGIPR